MSNLNDRFTSLQLTDALEWDTKHLCSSSDYKNVRGQTWSSEKMKNLTLVRRQVFVYKKILYIRKFLSDIPHFCSPWAARMYGMSFETNCYLLCKDRICTLMANLLASKYPHFDSDFFGWFPFWWGTFWYRALLVRAIWCHLFSVQSLFSSRYFLVLTLFGTVSFLVLALFVTKLFLCTWCRSLVPKRVGTIKDLVPKRDDSKKGWYWNGMVLK